MADEKKTYNIFVTGGSESAGLATVKALIQNGHNVVASATDADGALAIRRAGGLPAYPNLNRVGEIRSVLQMANIDIVVHAAPQVFGGIPQSDFDFEGHTDWLVDSTNAVVQAAGQNEVDKIISVSFGYLYESEHGDVISEEADSVHDKEYNAMLHAEAAVLDGGIDGYVIRAGYIYGGHSYGSTMISEIIKETRPVHKGTHTASWIHEDDLAAAIVALVEADADGNSVAQIINVADDTPQSPNDFASQLGAELGFQTVNFASPGFMTMIRGESMRDKLLKREVVLDTSKVKSQYGWSPQHTSTATGVDATTLVWRMSEATTADDFYNVYEDKAQEAIEALKSGVVEALPEETEEAAPEPVKEEAKAPVQAAPASPPPSDGPTPWNEDEAKREERRRKALERKKRRAEKAGG